MEGGKFEEPFKKPLGARTEPTTNSTHVPTTGTEPGSEVGGKCSHRSANLAPHKCKKGRL